MSAFAVATFHDALLPAGAARVDAVVWIRPAGLDEDGVAMALRIWTPAGARVGVLREVSPATGDLLDAAVRLDERSAEYPAGCWSDGAREYELAVDVTPGADGDELLAARVEIVAGEGEIVARAAISVRFSADARLLAAAGGAATVSDVAEIPTGPSPQPRHAATAAAHAGEPCPRCGEQTAAGDRYCEGCGRSLVAR